MTIKINILRNKFFLSLIFSLIFSSANYPIISSDYIEEEKNISPIKVEYLDQLPLNDYIIGEGDELQIEVSRDYPELKSFAIVDGEGTIYLPKLNRIYVKGLTISELNNLLNKAYKEFVLYPFVEVSIKNYRPIRVYVQGEVENPGLYTLKGSFQVGNDSIKEINSNKLESETSNNSPYFFPRVFDAVRASGGITEFSDLSKVELIRKNSISQGGGKKKTTIDFLEVLYGNISGNIRIYDSDIIRISKLKKNNSTVLKKAVLSNLNPKFIDVFLTGRLNSKQSSGKFKLPKGSVLSDAFIIAGGPKVLRGKVVFIRFKNDGTIDKRKFSYKNSERRGSFKNPYLKNGDLVYLEGGKIATITEVLNEISEPFTGIFSIYGLLTAITNN